MLVYYNEKIVDEFYHEELVDKVETNFSEDLFDDNNNLHIDLPEDFQLFQSLKNSTGYLLEDYYDLP